MTIAQMYFKELKDIPYTTYDMQIEASYNREVAYAGFGNYKEEYERQIKKKTEEAFATCIVVRISFLEKGLNSITSF